MTKSSICVRDTVLNLPSKPQWLLYVPPGLTFKILRSAHTVYLCSLCGSQKKQRLLLCTTLTDWFLGTFAKFRKVTIKSVRPHGTTRLPLDGFY